MQFILIEKEEEYVKISEARIKAWRKYVVLDEPTQTQDVSPNQLNLL